MNDELDLIRDADRRAQDFIAGIGTRPVFPGPAAIEALTRYDEPLPEHGRGEAETIELLDAVGTPATTASNDPRYFGFVTGSTLPVAAAADRLALAWDQSAASFDTSPTAAALEHVAGRWLTDILDLPRESAVGFTISAGVGTVVAIATARRTLLARAGWDIDRRGPAGAPEIKVVLGELAHITVKKALRVLGFGLDNLITAPVDEHGRIEPGRLPPLDDRTILILQAGEVNTGEFDPFTELIP
ncbi:pyridoxal phosphate-dependent decarboxylase family protein, partial [Glycomyces buryatensis]|uniref:pyridoxal phosphate-dependent decarboxylase family protein n=1 Tax=Glycomyces buryatensis TaxID=2570927 RepID=UPI001B3C14D3